MTVASPRTPPRRTPSASASTWSTTASGHEARERVARLLALERHRQAVDRRRERGCAASAGDERVDRRSTIASPCWNATWAPTRNTATHRRRRRRPRPDASQAQRRRAARPRRRRRSAARSPTTAPSRSGKPSSAVWIDVGLDLRARASGRCGSSTCCAGPAATSRSRRPRRSCRAPRPGRTCCVQDVDEADVLRPSGCRRRSRSTRCARRESRSGGRQTCLGGRDRERRAGPAG